MDTHAGNLTFKPSLECTVGIEIELQIINPDNGELASRAKDLLFAIRHSPYTDRIQPEITQSMIEINSSVHSNPTQLFIELFEINTFLVNIGHNLNIQFSGGGTHPFQMWKNREIFPSSRFRNVSRQYGYLAKRFTVFGQHIHIGCKNAEDALYLTQALSTYIPHFIALSASSPYYQGIDTAFDSSRSSVVLAFPTSGYMPYFKKWKDFCSYYKNLQQLHVIESIKDIYWDIRPKPEYGTVEIRICDTPLTLKKSVLLAAYAQVLSHYLLHKKPIKVKVYESMLYQYNRYQASRFGFNGNFINPHTSKNCKIYQDILNTLTAIKPHALPFGNETFIDEIYAVVLKKQNDSDWIRRRYKNINSLQDLVIQQAQLWKNVRS